VLLTQRDFVYRAPGIFPTLWQARHCYGVHVLSAGFLVMAVLVMVLVLIEARPKMPRWQYGVVKVVASLWFVAVGAIKVAEVDGAPYARWLFLGALALSLVGDVLLIPKGHKGVFFAGLFAFLAAHVLYVPAFVARGVDVTAIAVAVVVLGAPAALVLRWLKRHVKGSMWPPVAAYVVVITAMLATAIGAVSYGLTHSGGATPALAIGAFAFWCSDVCVARQRFVRPALVNKVIGVPLYFFAQLGLIAGAAG